MSKEEGRTETTLRREPVGKSGGRRPVRPGPSPGHRETFVGGRS